MTVYAKLDENSNIKEVVSKPKWTLSDGSEVTDQHLIPEGYIPVDYDTLKPSVDPFYQEAVPNFPNQWNILTGDTEVYIYDEEKEDFTLTTINVPYKVEVTYTINEKTLDELKQEFKQKIKEKFENIFNEPYDCQACNAQINIRQSDLYNMENLKTYMELQSLTQIDFRIYDNSYITISKDTLDSMIKEVKEYHVSLYHHKWNKEQELDQITTIDDLKTFEVW